MATIDHPDSGPDGLARQLAAAADSSAPCPDALTLASYLDGRADLDQRTAVEAHLATCVECLHAVRAARAPDATDAAFTLVPDRVLLAARALVPDTRPVARPRSMRLADWRAAARWSLATAATIVICLLGYQAGLSSLPAAPATGSDGADDVTFGLFSAALAGDLADDVFAVSLPETIQ